MTNSTQALLLNDRQEAKILPIPLIKKSVEYLRKFAGWFEAHVNNGAGVAPFGNTLFLCLKFHETLCYTLWGKMLEQSRYSALQTNIKSRLIKIEAFIGGLKTNNEDSHLMTHQPNTQTTSLFCPLIFITGASK